MARVKPDSQRVSPPPERPRYGWAAFHNPYNYAVLAGGVAASALTLNPAPLLLALGVEGLWMGLGTALPPFRRAVERAHEAQVLAWNQAQIEERLERLPPALAQGYRRAAELCDEIRAAEQGSLKARMLAEEIAQLGPLLSGWLELAEHVQQIALYLGELNRPELERLLVRQRKAVAQMSGATQAVGLKNLAVLEQRIGRAVAFEERMGVGQEQMKLMLNTLQLMRDELRAPDGALPEHASLTDVLEGLNAARQTLVELGEPGV